MTDESLQLPPIQSIDFHIVTLFERLEALRKERNGDKTISGAKSSLSLQTKKHVQIEIRTLEFWRSIISECLASFLYVFIVCGAAAGAGVGASVSSVLLATALASGFAISTLTQCFSHVSGAHINPSVTLAMAVTRAITPLRAAMYITAQCGGGIAGAALLYGVTVPGYQGNLQAAISHSSSLQAWERFGVELILTFVVVLTYFMSTDSYTKYFGSSSLAIGTAYSACSFVSMPYLNPARSLGPAFVLNKWDNHWVYWFGPFVGGALSGLVYEYVFNPKRGTKNVVESTENDTCSSNSDDDINFDLDLEKPATQKYQNSSYRSPIGVGGGSVDQQNSGNGGGYCQGLYNTGASNKFDHNEPLYGGTRSMYCKSPPLTRANLNRSQSVYAKSNSAINRELIPRPGPLVPAQSLYPMRVSSQTQNSHTQNQNVHNQLQQKSESIYGTRGSMRQNERIPNEGPIFFQPLYGTTGRNNPNIGNDPTSCKFERETRDIRTHRPDSIYGTTQQRRGQSAQSDDSSYGSYHGPFSTITPPTRIQVGGNQQSIGTDGLIPPPSYNSCQLTPGNGSQQHSMNRQQNHSERKTSSSGSDRQRIGGAGSLTPTTTPAIYNKQSIRQN